MNLMTTNSPSDSLKAQAFGSVSEDTKSLPFKDLLLKLTLNSPDISDNINAVDCIGEIVITIHQDLMAGH